MRRDRIEGEESREIGIEKEGTGDQRRHCHDRLKATKYKKADRKGRCIKQRKTAASRPARHDPANICMDMKSDTTPFCVSLQSQITTKKDDTLSAGLHPQKLTP